MHRSVYELDDPYESEHAQLKQHMTFNAAGVVSTNGQSKSTIIFIATVVSA